MYSFFPDNYMWSQATLRVLFTGGNPGEVLAAVDELAPAAESSDGEAWFAAWDRQSRILRDRVSTQEAAGHLLSAGQSWLRSSAYDQWAIAFMSHEDPRRATVHRRSLEAFARFGALQRPPYERVEVAYEKASFPAWYCKPSEPAGLHPAIFYLPGWDSTKEQGVELARALNARGIGALLCDGPGVGEAVLFRAMKNRYDYEVVASAAFDHLDARPDVDPRRIAVVGGSLGGYRAARSAAFEHRLAAAVCWGAVWDFHEVFERRMQYKGARSTPPEHALFVTGTKNGAELLAFLQPWTLDGVAEKIRCPLLILHGEEDVQTLVSEARKLYEAAGSARKELRIFTAEEGGSAHCQNDNRVLAHEYIADWLADLLSR